MRRLLLLTLAIVLSACSVGAPSELNRSQDKWDKSGITGYRYSLFIGCFCAFRDRMPLSIEVRDGKVVSMAYANGESISPDDPQLEFFSRFATLDALFAELKSGPASKADEVTVTYDSTYGYPSEMQVDQIKLAADDEYSVSISDFEILE